MTFALGRRFVIADGVERWKDADVAPSPRRSKARSRHADRRVLRARGGPLKVPPALVKAVEQAGGQVAEERTVKPGSSRAGSQPAAKELGIELDTQAAQALVAQRRRSPAAAAARAREARARARRRRAARRRGGRGSRRAARPSASSGRSPTRSWRATRGPRPARYSSCARRASALPGCSTRWSAGSATRSPSPRRSRPASRRAGQEAACGCPSFAADRLIADVGEARRGGLPPRARADGRPRARDARGGGGVLSEDTAAVRAVIGAAR